MLLAMFLLYGKSSGEHFELKADLNTVDRARFQIFTSSIQHTLITKDRLHMPVESYS